jgi:hypothetical protein
MKVTLEQLQSGLSVDALARHSFQLGFEKSPSVLIEGALFAFDSAFPAPGMLLHLAQIQRELEQRPAARIVVFGHTDVKGTEDYNKKLSDRRAKAVLALLKRELALFDAVAQQEDWGTGQYQAMLRALGCNPGAIDGTDGPMTQGALRGFQGEYNRNVYHGAEGSPVRSHPDLAVDGVLGPKSKAAIRDAYVAHSPCRLDAARFNAPAFAGCSEFIPIAENDEDNRRVAVALIEGAEPRAEDFPCKQGDIGACPVDRKQPMRCKFHRRHFTGVQRVKTRPFFDFKWLREKSGHVHLSALTSVPDDTPARFVIFRWESEMPGEMPSSESGGTPPEPGAKIEEVEGEIRGGVAFARWLPPEDFDPFHFPGWLLDHDVDLEIFQGDDPDGGAVSGEDLIARLAAHPPVFRVEASDKWGFSFPPSHELNDVRIVREDEGPGVAIGYDFGLVAWHATGGKPVPEHALPEDVPVLAMLMATRDVTPEEEEPVTA